MMTTIIAMVGLAQSGKTTEVENILRDQREWGIRAVAVNRDTLRLALYNGRYDPDREQDINELEELYVKAAAFYGEEVIIVDSCKHIEPHRQRWIDICEREGWELVFEVLKTPAEECIRRAEAKGDSYIIEVIKKQAREADFWEME